MGLYRDEAGLVFEADDEMAGAMGYSPVSASDEQQIYSDRGLAARASERGAAGAANAFMSRITSGATLGLTDIVSDAIMTPAEREQLLADIEAHPYVSTVGELAGGIAPALAAPGSMLAKTPTGYLSSLAGQQVEKGLAQGGLRGTARALNAMGTEGALQSAGQYLGHTALENKEATAEGLAGAVGTGYAFGTVGGGVGLGIAKGTIAARRLYSRVMDGPEGAKAAESAWTLVQQEALDADTMTAQSARDRLEAIQTAKREALKYRNEAKANTQEARIFSARRAAEATPETATTAAVADEFVGPSPLDEGIEPVGRNGQMPTQVYKRPVSGEIDPADAAAFDASLKQPETPAGKADLGGEQVVPGAAVSPQIPPSKKPPPYEGRNPSRSVEDWLAEKDAVIPRDPKSLAAKLNQPVPKGKYSAAELDRMASEGAVRGPVQDFAHHQVGPTKRAPFSNVRSALAQKLMPEIRYDRTAELLSPQIADEEARLVQALDDFDTAKEALKNIDMRVDNAGDLTAEQLALLRADNGTNPGKKLGQRDRIMETLDTAHEEALLSAQGEIDPVKAGEWLKRAEDIEDAMLNLPAGDDVYWNLKDGIEIVTGYEKAAAKLADEIGDAAHPISIERTKAFNDAERESERKLFERTARAVDDEVEIGSEAPRMSVREARIEQLAAQRKLDDVSAQERDMKAHLDRFSKKAKAGEKAKKAALRTDAQAARAGSKIGAAEQLGVLDMLDLPGMPKASDIPVVGPLLSTWLKFRVMKAALGRKMGRVAASPDARAAALASRTRDRIARAVDRSLGGIEKGGKVISRNAPRMAGILAARIYDDGEPSPPKGAPIGEQAAARIRELAAYVNTPGAIERDVRTQLRGVTDPDLIKAAEAHRRVMMEYALKAAPKAPEQGMMQTIKWQPSPAQSMSFARTWEALNDPAGVYERTADSRSMISLEAAEVMRNVYPQMLAQAQQRVQERIAMQKAMIPYRQRVQLSLLYKLPLDSALEPDNLKITQSVYERKPASPAYNPAVVPPTQPPTATPSIAQPVDVSQAYMPTMDKR